MKRWIKGAEENDTKLIFNVVYRDAKNYEMRCIHYRAKSKEDVRRAAESDPDIAEVVSISDGYTPDGEWA